MSDQNLEILLDNKALSLLLRVLIGTLRGWRTRGCGPRFRRVGPQLVRYSPSDVQKWLDRRPSGGEAKAEAAQ
jgi:hypothetical protein